MPVRYGELQMFSTESYRNCNETARFYACPEYRQVLGPEREKKNEKWVPHYWPICHKWDFEKANRARSLRFSEKWDTASNEPMLRYRAPVDIIVAARADLPSNPAITGLRNA